MTFSSLRKMFDPIEEEAFRKAWEASKVSGKYDFEYRLQIAGGTKWLRSCAEIEFDSDGRPRTAIGTVQKVTERKRAEEALREAERNIEACSRMRLRACIKVIPKDDC